MFYLIQYSISNVNAFMLIITIGYYLYCYVQKDEPMNNGENKENGKQKIDKDGLLIVVTDSGEQRVNLSKGPYNVDNTNLTISCENTENSKKEVNKDTNLTDAINSPIQLIDQLKGFFYINPILSLSLGITLFSFAGIPPLIGFFGKQMVLSAAMDSGYIFMALVAILTSVISAVYYLAIIKQIFFDKPNYSLNEQLKTFNAEGLITEKKTTIAKVNIEMKNIVISSSLSLSISVITLVITLFIFTPEETLSLANILALLLFNI